MCLCCARRAKTVTNPFTPVSVTRARTVEPATWKKEKAATFGERHSLEIFYPTWLVLTVSLPASYVKETFSLIHTQISTCCVSGGTTPPVRLWRELFKVDSDDETGWDKKESIAVLHLKDVSIYLMRRIALWEIQENALMDQTFFKGTAMSEPHLHQFWPLFWTFHTIVF